MGCTRLDDTTRKQDETLERRDVACMTSNRSFLPQSAVHLTESDLPSCDKSLTHTHAHTLTTSRIIAHRQQLDSS
eukprot:6468396-Amphidinium_carterae.2